MCGNKKGNQAISREDIVFSNSMSIFKLQSSFHIVEFCHYFHVAPHALVYNNLYFPSCSFITHVK
jgi:hypothetical protein